MMIWCDHDMGWWGYAAMGIGMVLFWALLVVGIVALVRLVTNPKQAAMSVATPPQVLADRLARGEITESEYREKSGCPKQPLPTLRHPQPFPMQHAAAPARHTQ
ncbi:SHOCT domain-containing protein [Mycolicibacterium fortuitum]